MGQVSEKFQSNVSSMIPFLLTTHTPMYVCTVCVSIDDVDGSPTVLILVTSGDRGKLINFLFRHLLLFGLF